MSDAEPPAPNSRQRPAATVTLAVGAGWGALLGMAFGFVIPPISDLLTFRDSDPGPIWFLLVIGFFTAPVGLMFGAVAGFIAAAIYLPFAAGARPALVARVVAGVVGPLVVGALSLAVFHPSLEVGANQTQDHRNETILLFYVLPCASALVAGTAFGSRLARPR